MLICWSKHGHKRATEANLRFWISKTNKYPKNKLQNNEAKLYKEIYLRNSPETKVQLRGSFMTMPVPTG